MIIFYRNTLILPGKIADGSNASVADDSYHKYKVKYFFVTKSEKYFVCKVIYRRMCI